MANQHTMMGQTLPGSKAIMNQPAIEIHQIDTTRRDEVNRFVLLPSRLYRNSSLWVPALLDDERLLLNRKKHPYYLHSDAAFFVAVKHGEDVGRIAVLNPKHYNQFNRSDVRFIDGRTPGYATLNFRAGTALGEAQNHKLSVALENVTDQYYRVLGSGVDGAGFNAIFGYEYVR